MAGFGLSGLLNGIAGSALTAKLRADGMTALMRQEIGFFDVDENSAPNLTTFLSEKVEKVQTLTTEQLDLIAQILGGVGSSMVIIFWLCSWRLALAWGAVLPIFAIIASLEISFMSGGADADAAKKGKDPSKRSTSEKTANHIVGEAVSLPLSHSLTPTNTFYVTSSPLLSFAVICFYARAFALVVSLARSLAFSLYICLSVPLSLCFSLGRRGSLFCACSSILSPLPPASLTHSHSIPALPSSAPCHTRSSPLKLAP